MDSSNQPKRQRQKKFYTKNDFNNRPTRLIENLEKVKEKMKEQGIYIEEDPKEDSWDSLFGNIDKLLESTSIHINKDKKD